MPEHDELLPGFHDVDVRPLPAAEIRARGDRLRRRRTTLTVLGAAASVALVAGGIGIVTGSGQQVQPAPAPASPTSGSDSERGSSDTIPDDFPLAAGLSDASANDRTISTGLSVCDRRVYPSGTELESLGVTSGEGPASHLRVLVLYPSADVATTAVDNAAAAVERCPVEEVPGRTTHYQAIGFDTGAQFGFTESAEGSTGFTYRLVRVGNALLFSVDPGGAAAMSDLDGVVAAMARFDQGGVTGAGAIPPGFPLDVDQVAMEGDGGEMRGPSESEVGLRDLELCGSSVWSAPGFDRLASTATGPEYADVRELRVYATADDAVQQMEGLRALLADCPEEAVDGGGRLVHAPLEEETGYDSVTWADYYTEGLGGGPVQFVRVGRAVLAIARGGEFSEASVADSGEQVTALSRAIALSMCAFSDEGCSPSEPALIPLGPDGILGWQLGMSLDEALAAGGRRLGGQARCPSLVMEPDALPKVTATVDPDQGIVSLSVTGGAATPENVGIGATAAEVREVYPDAEGDRDFLTVDTPDGEAYYRFDFGDGKVAGLLLLARDQSCAS